MYTPFDWQESIGSRAEYAEERLKHGAPVFGISLQAGILLFTYKKQAPKLFEVYDRIAMGAIGQQSDIETIRVGAVEFASREGFQRSEADVTIQRVASAVSQPIKTAFANFSYSPVILRAMFAEVGDSPKDDVYCLVNYNGDFTVEKERVLLTGLPSEKNEMDETLASLTAKSSPDEAIPILDQAWKSHIEKNSDEETSFEDFRWEAMLIERSTHRENRFQIFSEG